MAEIKSTLEKVMEKLAQIDAGSGDEYDSEEKIKDGMRLGARFFRGEIASLHQALTECTDADKPFVQSGVIKTMLRNILLPRDADQQKDSERAMQGLIEMSQGSTQIIDLCTDMKHVLDRYLAHKDQYRTQLESAFRTQMGQLEESITEQTGMSMKLDPSQHPKFLEEWNKIVSELDEQYGNALQQLKDQVDKACSIET